MKNSDRRKKGTKHRNVNFRGLEKVTSEVEKVLNESDLKDIKKIEFKSI